MFYNLQFLKKNFNKMKIAFKLASNQYAKTNRIKFDLLGFQLLVDFTSKNHKNPHQLLKVKT